MALAIFDPAPDLLPLVEVLEAHKHPGLELVTRFSGLPLELKSAGQLRGRPLVTELLRLAAVGHAFLRAAADHPDRSAGDLARQLRGGDADLLIFLER